MIVAEKRVVKPVEKTVEKREENNPQTLFSRWNIPGFRGRTAEEPRSVKESFGRKFAMSKKKKALNKRAHEKEDAQKRLNMFYAPPPIPTFDPFQVQCKRKTSFFELFLDILSLRLGLRLVLSEMGSLF